MQNQAAAILKDAVVGFLKEYWLYALLSLALATVSGFGMYKRHRYKSQIAEQAKQIQVLQGQKEDLRLEVDRQKNKAKIAKLNGKDASAAAEIGRLEARNRELARLRKKNKQKTAKAKKALKGKTMKQLNKEINGEW